MAFSETQLDTWSRQGSVTQSCDTYNTIRDYLYAKDSGYADKSFDVFLQGSYGNDTNIYAESDVDLVIRLDSAFRYDLDNLSDTDKQAYRNYVIPATYSLTEFKTAVVAHLRKRFGDDVVVGKKAITIKSNGTRRNADVIVCQEYRKLNTFNIHKTEDYVSGILFSTPTGDIINYPKQHSANLTQKHQATSYMLKPMVRILKNMRSRMVDDGLLNDGVAPSYYIEGMFYNVPKEQYARSFGDTFCNGINWLLKCEKGKLVCANWQYWLLGSSNVQWNERDFNTFLEALCSFWKNGQS